MYMFILKIASLCNLDCTYCYVYQGPDQSWRDKPKFLAASTLEQIATRIQEHVQQHGLREVSVVFHGGEPLLAGLERLETYVAILSSIITCPIKFGMQTNGILLDRPIIEFLFRNEFRVGLSIDGDKISNDRHRVYRDKRSSYDDTVKAIRLFQSFPDHRRVFGGVLVVVDIRNQPATLLQALRDLGLQSANLLLPDCNHANPPSRPNDDLSIYGKWFAELYTRWLDDYADIEIPYFEEIMNLMMGGESTSEEIGAQSVDFLVIDTNGDLEAVDTLKMVGRAATTLHLNVATHSIDDALQHPAVYSRMSGFGALCVTCRKCEFLSVCGGGYLPHRYSVDNGFINPSVYCEDLKHLFRHIRGRLFAT